MQGGAGGVRAVPPAFLVAVARGTALLREVARTGAKTTARARMLPDYLIIGVKRGGTSSLHAYLAAHPAILTANVTKGSHYFDVKFDHGWAWYRSHFPTVLYRSWLERSRGCEVIAGESSPYYIFHPLALSRISQALPSAKLIVLLRDPVARAYSHYHYERHRGFETEPIEVAIGLEDERLAGEEERIRAEPGYVSAAHRHHSYLARGLYFEQIRRVYALFPERQVLILPSERLYTQPRSNSKSK